MKLLPYDRLTLRSAEAPAMVAARLAKIVAVGWFFLRTPPQPFRGSITGNRFKVVRILGAFHQNSWQPVIVGDIAAAPEGTEVRVTMRPHAYVAAFTALSFVGLFSLIVFALRIAVRDAREWNPGLLLVPLGMTLFGYALVSFSFWSDAKKARRLLCEGLGCRQVEPGNRLMRR